MSEVSSECLWVVNHRSHFAWFQRAFVVGDHRQDLGSARSEYVVLSSGHSVDPHHPPVCTTCKEIGPNIVDLQVYERSTGRAWPLYEIFCTCAKPQIGAGTCHGCGRTRWPEPTNQERCWYCNCDGETVETSSSILVCIRCVDHLRSEQERIVRQRSEEVS